MRGKLISLMSLLVLTAGCTSSGPKMAAGKTANTQAIDVKTLKQECERIEQIYPRLMLASMMEGPMICVNEFTGEEFECNEDETAQEKAERELRLKTRKKQEMAAKKADMACDAFEEELSNNELKQLAFDAIRAAQISNTGTP